jgi:hypothetical protein
VFLRGVREELVHLACIEGERRGGGEDENVKQTGQDRVAKRRRETRGGRNILSAVRCLLYSAVQSLPARTDALPKKRYPCSCSTVMCLEYTSEASLAGERENMKDE